MVRWRSFSTLSRSRGDETVVGLLTFVAIIVESSSTDTAAISEVTCHTRLLCYVSAALQFSYIAVKYTNMHFSTDVTDC